MIKWPYPIWSLIRFIYEWVEIDIIATKYKFQENAIYNSIEKTLSNNEKINILSLKDLILFKLYANSYKDIADVDTIIQNNRNHLEKDDILYIENTLKEFWITEYFYKFFPHE